MARHVLGDGGRHHRARRAEQRVVVVAAAAPAADPPRALGRGERGGCRAGARAEPLGGLRELRANARARRALERGLEKQEVYRITEYILFL